MIFREITIDRDEITEAVSRLDHRELAFFLSEVAGHLETRGSSAPRDFAQQVSEDRDGNEELIDLARIIVAEVDSCCEHMGLGFDGSYGDSMPRAERGQVHLDARPFDAQVGRGETVELGCWDPAEALEYAAALTKAAHEASAQREEMAAGSETAPKTSTIVDIGALLTGGRS